MAGKQRSIAGEEARKLCEAFPSHGTRTLASKLLRDNPALYTSYEQARSLVRDYRGEHGVMKRNTVKAKVRTTKHEQIPPSDAKPIEAVVFPHTGRGVVCSDLHIPYHDPEAVRLMLEFAVTDKATDFCIVNGDFNDFYRLSRWEQDIRNRDVNGELELGDQMLSVLLEHFPVVWLKLGNHDAWYERYLRVKAPELLGIADYHLESLYHLPDRGIKLVQQHEIIHAGHLTIVHGHEFKVGTSNPVNAARGLYLRCGGSAICGHWHQPSHHSAGTIRGKRIGAWATGCLCTLTPEYDPTAFIRWAHGFAVLELDSSGEFEVDNHTIVEGKVR